MEQKQKIAARILLLKSEGFHSKRKEVPLQRERNFTTKLKNKFYSKLVKHINPECRSELSL